CTIMIQRLVTIISVRCRFPLRCCAMESYTMSGLTCTPNLERGTRTCVTRGMY
ncbi:hypothetical protein SARC_16680, partial [Sphaeroforma arctica JP610]